jgi:hypothetical protein
MTPQATATAPQSERLQVFLCHSSGDKKAVRELYAKLTADGLDPWLDEKKLLPGQDWKYEISKAVRKSSAIVVCISKNSASKEGFLQREIKDALDVADEKPEGTIFIIPARLEDCEIPERLRRWQWVNLFHEEGYDSLLRALRSRALDLGIAMPRDRTWLSETEELALGLVLSDPNAGERGAWLYPLHNDLTQRGYTQAQATLALNGLTAKGLLQFVEVVTFDPDTKAERKAPAYRITAAGIDYANSSEGIRGFHAKYRYQMVLQGSRKKNQPFLEYLLAVPHVEQQTRFIDEKASGRSRIAVFSYQPLDENLLKEEAARASLTLLSIHKL